MPGRLNTDDMVAVQDVLGRYNWAVDSGDGAAYAALYTADGHLVGPGLDAKGPEQLAGVPVGSRGAFGGNLRHHMTDVVAEYGEDRNTAKVKGRNVLILWAPEGFKFSGLAESAFVLVRDGDGWKIKSNTLDLRTSG